MKAEPVKVAVINFPGSAVDPDMLGIFRGDEGAEIVEVPSSDTSLGNFSAVILPGGASYGDALRPGAVAALGPIIPAVIGFAEAGKPVVGLGNGFQVLTEIGLLPGALLKNRQNLFTCETVGMTVETDRTPITRTLAEGGSVRLPIAHGYGNYWCDAETLADLENGDQIVLVYNEDVNGATGRIAGVCNKAGNVVGIMARPERATEALLGSTDGQSFFESLASATSASGEEER